MSDIIRLLPDHLANQIAAGEVVQRPSSVVKELLENAIDAGADQISLLVKESGKSLIQVVDNGKGMSMTDSRMCFERHATSKIQTTDDLFSIRTMGFRGEAMASIAAVAQVELKSRRREDELGVLIQIEGSEVKRQEPESHPVGTTISVKNLFFNVPARRNFLKSNAVEMRHIVDEFHHVALSHPEVSMSLHQNDLEMYSLPASKLSKRIVNIFGRKYQDQMASCEEETEALKVWGYIGKPDSAKKTRGEQFFFANNRYIKSAYLNHAVTTAFEGLLQEGTYPFYTIFIEIDPKHIDINVHPTKTEIKFDDERTVYAIVKAAVRQALGTHNIAPAIDFSQDVNFSTFTSQKTDSTRQGQQDRAYGQFKTLDQNQPSGSWEKLYEGLKSDLKKEEEDNAQMSLHPEAPKTITLSSAASDPNTTIKQAPVKKLYFQIHQKYIATQVKSGLMLIDQHRAHERILFERFLHQLEKRNGASQQSLFPQTLELNGSDFSLITEMSEELHAIGFKFSPFGQSAVIIDGIPADLRSANEKQLLEGFIEQFKHFQTNLSISSDEKIARAVAQRSALKSGILLTQEEMSSLIDQLFACKQPGYAPDGTMTTHIVELDKIDQIFN
jgi:DNA mismatch repair protein MutL